MSMCHATIPIGARTSPLQPHSCSVYASSRQRLGQTASKFSTPWPTVRFLYYDQQVYFHDRFVRKPELPKFDRNSLNYRNFIGYACLVIGYPDNCPNGHHPERHHPEWTPSRLGTIPNGRNPKWAQSRMGSVPNGHRPEWAPSRMGTVPNGHRPEWAPSRMGTVPNGHNPEWTQSRMDTIPNGHHPEWTPTRVDTIPNGHNHE